MRKSPTIETNNNPEQRLSQAPTSGRANLDAESEAKISISTSQGQLKNEEFTLFEMLLQFPAQTKRPLRPCDRSTL
jgi:hypothetical protein